VFVKFVELTVAVGDILTFRGSFPEPPLRAVLVVPISSMREEEKR